MVEMNSYGGTLCIFFRDKITNLFIDGNTIRFTHAVIGIINYNNGSGWDTQLEDFTFEIQFNRNNLFVDNAFKYSYGEVVCGNVRDWCDDTEYTIVNKDNNTPVVESQYNRYRQDEEFLDDRYRSGKCTIGDMDMSRHRDVEYDNNYPAGHRCPHCGTFWID